MVENRGVQQLEHDKNLKKEEKEQTRRNYDTATSCLFEQLALVLIPGW
jgi:hypothetical protein